jgi:hypothetical protein
MLLTRHTLRYELHRRPLFPAPAGYATWAAWHADQKRRQQQRRQTQGELLAAPPPAAELQAQGELDFKAS